MELPDQPLLWSDFLKHHERGGLLLLAAGEDLDGVAAAMARDDTQLIAGLLSAAALVRPGADQAQAWAQQEPPPRFRFRIVQPWVLIQESEG